MKTAIYYLLYKHSGNIAYIGKTRHPVSRKSAHKRSHPFCRFEIQYWAGGCGSEEEKREIAKHSPPLNRSSGGDGGYVFDVQTKRKMSLAQKGKKKTEEHRRKIIENHARHWKGKKKSEHTRRKMSLAKKKYYAENKHNREKKTKATNIKTGEVYIFDSAVNAAERLSFTVGKRFYKSSISSVCTGRYKEHHGFSFEYV